MTDIVPSNVQVLLDEWIKAEQEGDEFPVPLDVAYPMAGYEHKRSAKAKLPKTSLGELYTVLLQKSTGGRPAEDVRLSIKGLEHLCMMADTQAGYEIREYFRRCRNVLKEVEKVAPEVVRQAEALVLRKEVLDLELKLLEKREYIATALPEPMQQKILGYQLVERVEYRDRTITPDGDKLDGIGITYIAQRFGFGKNTKKAWQWLESIGYGRDSGKWHLELAAVESHKLPSNALQELDALADRGNRQRWLGE